MPVLADELARLQAHRWQISDLAFSPDGTRLASAGWDKEVNIWELSNLEKVVNLSNVHHVPITSVSWLRPNGLVLCTGSADRTAALWNAETGDFLGSLDDHPGWVLGTDFSATGAFLATACWDHVVRIWDPGTETLINSMTGHSGGVWSVNFHPHSSQLCTASEDGSVRIWDARTNRPVGKLCGQHTEAVYCATWSPDGSVIATGSADNKICIWEPKQQAVINTIYAHQDTVKSLAFNPLMENVAVPVLASAGGDKLCLSDPRPSHRADILSLSLHKQGKEVEAVAVSPDGSLLVSGSRDGLIVLMTLMVPSVIPRSDASHMHLTSSVLRKSRVVRDREYIYDATMDDEIPPELREDEEDVEANWAALQLEAEEMADQFLMKPKKLEKQTSFSRMKRRSRYEEKETELPDYATVRKKKGLSAKTARGKRTKGKSYDIPTMVAHLSASVRVYGPEELNSSSDSEGEEERRRPRKPEPEQQMKEPQVDILSHIKAWSHPENISTPAAQKTKRADLPQSVGKAKTHKEFFESGEPVPRHLREGAEEDGQEEEEGGQGKEEDDQTEGEFMKQYGHLLPAELENTLQSSFSPANLDTEALLQQTTDQYNSYRLEDLMTINSEDSLLQWSNSPMPAELGQASHEARQHGSGDRHSQFSPTLPTQPEQEEEEDELSDDDSVPMSMI